jgi:hypothetical protein
MPSHDERKRERRILFYKQCAFAALLGGLVATVAFGAAANPDRWLLAAMGAVLVAAAPFASGGLVGFLFGIPKSLHEAGVPAAQAGGGAAEARAARAGAWGLHPNTNLEQISDWLTKILVGVGLTQLNSIPSALQSMAEYTAGCMGLRPSDCGVATVGAILIYFAVAGFLVGYLLTRLVLAPAIRATEEPPPEVVDRIANAPLPPTADPNSAKVSERDAAEMLSFSLEDLKTPAQLIAWGRARLEEEPASALEALGRACRRAPDDRRARESLIFASLYDVPPCGFERAITCAREYLRSHVDAGRGPTPPDANLYAYLACALGQKISWCTAKGIAFDLPALRAEILDAVGKAIHLDPRWKATFRALSNPAPGSGEDDLVALKGDADLAHLVA